MSFRDVARASLPRGGNLGNLVGYRPVPVAPDPERDKRVAARRAADAAKAGRALDRLTLSVAEQYRTVYDMGWRDGYAASEVHHNGHYDVFLPTGGEIDREPGSTGPSYGAGPGEGR